VEKNCNNSQCFKEKITKQNRQRSFGKKKEEKTYKKKIHVGKHYSNPYVLEKKNLRTKFSINSILKKIDKDNLKKHKKKIKKRRRQWKKRKKTCKTKKRRKMKKNVEKIRKKKNKQKKLKKKTCSVEKDTFLTLFRVLINIIILKKKHICIVGFKIIIQ
jgi:hypothetical protein